MKDKSSKHEARTVRQGPPGPMTNSPPDDPVEERIRRTVARWEAKCTPERTTAILTDKARLMHERYVAQAKVMALIDHRVGEVTDAAGIPRMMRIWYKSFGREVFRIRRTIPSSCREIEYDVIRHKWTARGLDPILLTKVKVGVVELLDKSGLLHEGDKQLT